MANLVFISMPYSHEDEKVVNERIEKSRQLSLTLLKQEATSISPALWGRDLMQSPTAEGLDSSFDYWSKMCLDFLYKSDMVIFLMLEGFEASKGMLAEYEYAIKHGKPVLFLDSEFKITDKHLKIPSE